jgi:hypothetical protein
MQIIILYKVLAGVETEALYPYISNPGHVVHSFAKKKCQKPNPSTHIICPLWGHLSVFTERFFLKTKNLGNLNKAPR